MAPLAAPVNYSLRAEPANSESEIEPEIDKFSSDSHNDSDNDSSIEVSVTDLSETKDYDRDSHELSDLLHRKRLNRDRSRISDSSDAVCGNYLILKRFSQ